MDFFYAGLVWTAFLGMVVGNYATNPIYRLPRRDPIFGRKPYCGDCNTELQPKDLFPIFSWLATRGKCRYCGAKVPAEYFLIEVWTTIVFMLGYARHGFSEPYILVSFGLTAFIMIAMMEQIDKFFSWAVLGWAGALGMVYAVMVQHSMYPALGGAFYSLMAAAAFWKLSKEKNVPLPNYVPLLAVVGIWLGNNMNAYLKFGACFAFGLIFSAIILKRTNGALWAALALCAVLLF